METIQQKLALIEGIREDFRAYLAHKLPSVGKFHKQVIDRIEAAMSTLQVKKVKEPLDIASMFATFSYIKTLDAAAATVMTNISYISQETGRDDSSFSGTYAAETSRMYVALAKKYSKAETEGKFLTNAIAMTFVSNIPNSIEAFKEARKAYHATAHTVQLYAMLAQAVIDEMWSVDKPTAYALMADVEEDKIRSLGVPKKRKSTRRNPPMRSFCLMGIRPTRLLADVLKSMFGSTNLATIAAKHSVCFVLEYRVTNTPMEMHIDTLLDWKRETRPQPRTVGVNPIQMRHMKTIVRGSPAKWKFETKVVGSLDSPEFVVLETLNGTTFRPMTPWLDMNSPTKIPRRYLRGLIAHLSGKPSGLDAYNEALSQKIVDKMFLPKPVDARVLSAESKVIDPKFLRNDIFLELMRYCSAKKVKTMEDFERVIFSDELTNKLADYLIKYDKIEKMSNFRHAELVVDFLSELQYILRGFTQEIYDTYAKMPITATTFKHDDTIRLAFEDLLNAVLQSVITDTKNVYQAMLFKDKLLHLRAN
jgi:hypothetical protein